MEKRAFLAIALSILVLVIYQEWVTRYYGVPPPPNPAKQETEKPAPPQPTAPARVTPSAPAVQTAKAAKDIKVETDNYVAIFTTQGARLKSFKFKKYRNSADENSSIFDIVSLTRDVLLFLGVCW